MPNWITNEVKAPSHVIAAMLNEQGDVDFSQIVSFRGEWQWGGIICSAETLAEAITNKPLSDNSLLQTMQISNRAKASLSDLTSDEAFEQFIQMLRNYRSCGMLHSMDFARKHWGTKWNACEPSADVEAGCASFETAWSCPHPVLEALSKRFPEDEIKVLFADEDIGSNCGTFTLKAGEYIASDFAPSWSNQTDAEKEKWRDFACSIKGYEPSDLDE